MSLGDRTVGKKKPSAWQDSNPRPLHHEARVLPLPQWHLVIEIAWKNLFKPGAELIRGLRGRLRLLQVLHPLHLLGLDRLHVSELLELGKINLANLEKVT